MANASPSDAIRYLESASPKLLTSVFEGGCVPWFGSAISASPFPDLPKLILRGLTSLFDNSKPGDSSCPFYSELVRLTSLASPHKLVLTDHPSKWLDSERIEVLKKLTNQYTAVLGSEVSTGGHVVSMRWDLLDLISLYSDPAVKPDAEHRFIAHLIEEGVFPEMVTTNWDPLIERAEKELNSTRDTQLHSIACYEELDLAGRNNSSLLYKIHGCAQKAKDDPPRYKSYMVATGYDVNKWTAAANPFAEAVRTVIRQRPVIFVGLSGQDTNIQVQFISATLSSCQFDPTSSRLFFCGSTLSENHRTLLRSVYGPDVYAEKQIQINDGALIKLYGKPILGALFFEVLWEKLNIVLNRGNAEFRPATQTFIATWLPQLKHDLIGYLDWLFDKTAADDSWRKIESVISSFLSWFDAIYQQQTPPPATFEYRSLLPHNPHSHLTDPALPQRGLHWLGMSILILFAGRKWGKWQIAAAPPSLSATHPLNILAAGQEFNVFIVGDSIEGLSKLINSGQIDPASATQRSVVIYPNGQEPAKPRRSPSRHLPVAPSKSAFVDLWLRDLYNDCPTEHELTDQIHNLLI